MTFLHLIVLLVFETLFICVSMQMRRMAEAGKKIVGHLPENPARKFSDFAYAGYCFVVGWAAIIIGGLIYNIEVKVPSGIEWSIVYFIVLSIVYIWLWVKNRHVDLQPL